MSDDGWSIEAPKALSAKATGEVIASCAPQHDLRACLIAVDNALAEQMSSEEPAQTLRGVIDVARYRGAQVLDGARVNIVRATRSLDAERLGALVRVGQMHLRLDHGNESDLLLRLTAAWELAGARERSRLSQDESTLLGLFLDLARPDMRDVLVDPMLMTMWRGLLPRLPDLADELVAFFSLARDEIDHLTSIAAAEDLS